MKNKILTIGIQGGCGSFNEQAINYYIEKENVQNYKIKYLYTSEKVLKALTKNKIDRGQFAIQNSLSGIVNESLLAMSKYNFKILDRFDITIAHTLMIRADANFKEIDTIMTHPQVLGQCKNTLATKYPHLKLTSGTDDLIEHATVAKHLSQKKLPKNIATLGGKILAKIYNLKIIDTNLQDAKENYTTFLLVKKAGRIKAHERGYH